jgi:cellulose synthase (UDP-forming)
MGYTMKLKTRRNRDQLPKISASELRGILLVILGVIALGFYYSWWFQEGRLTSPWLLLGFMAALFYGIFQILASWVLYLGTHHQPVALPPRPDNLTVDVFVTACNEEYELVELSLTAACSMAGRHNTWLLDDGSHPALAQLARRLGAGYLTRDDRKDAKAGNVNAALSHTQGEGDIVVIFDVDHVPEPDFLQRTLGFFADPTIGFVQVMPTFYNIQKGWVARAAMETSLDFYNPTSKGMDAFYSATKMGTNSLIRRVALESIGGYQPGLAEDLATSIALHAAGWRSRYVAEPLAPGLAPPDLTVWLTQQFKWARGVFEILVTAYPRFLSRLNWGQRLSYAVRTTKYLIGPVFFIHLAAAITILFAGNAASHTSLQQYFVHLAPLALVESLIMQLALRRWRHPSVPINSQWRAAVLVYVTWPTYTLAWIMTLLRLPLSFRPTPKNSEGRLNVLWLLPQLVSAILLVSGVIYSVTTMEKYGAYLLLYFGAVCFAIPQLGLIRPLLGSVFLAFSRGDLPTPIVLLQVRHQRRGQSEHRRN